MKHLSQAKKKSMKRNTMTILIHTSQPKKHSISIFEAPCIFSPMASPSHSALDLTPIFSFMSIIPKATGLSTSSKIGSVLSKEERQF